MTVVQRRTAGAQTESSRLPSVFCHTSAPISRLSPSADSRLTSRGQKNEVPKTLQTAALIQM